MNKNPIGVFDSGVGGLTVLKYLQESLPNENFIYCGDTKRVPYGNRSREEIIEFSLEIVDFLLEKKVKSIVIACNTIDSIAFEEIQKVVNLPVLGIINSGVDLAIETSTSGNIGLIATNGTVNSNIYLEKIKARGDFKLTSKAIPDFVNIVESNDKSNLEDVMARDLEEIKKSGIDTLILGCTHFPILYEEINNYLGGKIRLVDPAKRLSEKILEDYESSYDEKNELGETKYYITGDPKNFQAVALNILDKKLENVYVVSL